MLDSEIEALGLLAYKRGLFYESKKDSLRQDIDRLRNFLEAMSKDRELMQKQVKVEHILCKKKLARSEKELHETQNCLRETQNEAACLLESKHVEMERLQKERDEAMAKVETLCAESCFLKQYGNHLEQKVCALVVKLHEYHQHLQTKTEEVVQTRGRAVDELEWVTQNMASFEGNLLEFQNTNAQVRTRYVDRSYHASYDSGMIDDYVTMPMQGLEVTLSRHSLEDTICDYSSTEE